MLPPNPDTWAETASVLTKLNFEAVTIHYNSSILLSVVSDLFKLILQTFRLFGFFFSFLGITPTKQNVDF